MGSPSPEAGRWARVKAVFQDAVGLPAGARSSLLDDACGGDDTLRTEVERLLASHDGADDFLSTPVVERGVRILAEGDASLAGHRIGPYRITAEIGRGGMGAVYAAVRADDQYEQKVAIKIVKRGMDTDFVLQRFRGERQILAALDHPNIARLLDGGTTGDGLPYFVMEHIDGQPLPQYADARGLSVGERLALFRAVCSAVHYAHQNLVVHRDIKPGNILVTPQGVPKLLDFGIAKLLDPEDFGLTIAPTAMAQRLMTPDYASPEQVKGEAITTATDVYSLGVLLYELLTGRRPYRLRSFDPGELLRVICEEEPVPPSQALSRAADPLPSLGATVAAEAGRVTFTLQPVSGSAPGARKLRRELEGDLDTIVMMALRKEPRRRYASVEQFSADVQRHLEGLPVTARKDTLFYRTGKFVRRNRAAVAAAALAAAALMAGAVGTLWQAREAQRERARAERRFEDVRRLANSFLFEFHDAIETLPGSTRARELVVKRAVEYLDSLAGEADEPGLRRELAEGYRRVGDVQGSPYFANLGDTAGALASYRKALALDEASARADPSSAAHRLFVSVDHNKIGDILLQRGDSRGALSSHDAALQVAEALRAEDASVAVLRRVFVAHTKVGEARLRAGDRAGARASYAGALRAAEAQAAVEDTPRARRDLSVAHVNLGDLAADAGDPRGSLQSFGRAREIREALLAGHPTDTRARYDMAGLLERIGTQQAALGDLPAALASQQEGLAVISAVADADPANAGARRGRAISEASVGRMLLRLGRRDEALAAFRRAEALGRGLVAGDPDNAAVRAELAEFQVLRGEALRALGQEAGACGAFAEAAEGFRVAAASGPLAVQHAVESARLEDRAARCPGR